MNRAALTRLRQRIEVLRCPMCNRLALEPESPVPATDNLRGATTDELHELHSLFAIANERKVEIVPALCQKCHRPPVASRLELNHLSDDELNRLVDILERIKGRDSLANGTEGGNARILSE